MKTWKFSCCEILRCLCCKLFKKCPRPVCCFERRKCRWLRVQLAAASPIDLPDGLQFVFINRLSGFNTPECPGSAPPTVEQLAEISKALRIGGCWLCPMLVWATRCGIPVLTRVKPGCRRPVRVVCTPSLHCKAFIIRVIKEDCIRLRPCGSIPLRQYQPPESITAVTFKAFTEEGAESTVALYDVCSRLLKSAEVDCTPERIVWTCLRNPAFIKNDGCATIFICRLTLG